MQADFKREASGRTEGGAREDDDVGAGSLSLSLNYRRIVDEPFALHAPEHWAI